jgi:RNA polymerase sigma-70 factor (ECF subfamily)
MSNEELIPHLFRTEYRKIVSVHSRRFGFAQIEIAEDIASDTFLTASQTWGVKGVPENPAAWLYTVASNKAKNHLQRDRVFENRVTPELQYADSGPQGLEIDLSPHNISDSQLRMMFAICHPSISTEAQVGLSLRILCGFGIDEIADAFLTSKETINKRLFRAKEKLREARIELELPDPSAMEERLAAVLTTIYLLFNEGYYSVSQNTTLRTDLCLEAIRLCIMLVENESTDTPQVNALLALMCFHASRFEARMKNNGELVPYGDQDPALWNAELIARGVYYLYRAARGGSASKYQLEAGIAYWHTQKADTPEKWGNILKFYDLLLQIDYSPIAALNRAFALSKVNGKKAAIPEAEKLSLTDNHLYYTLLGELHAGIDNRKAQEHFQRAVELARSEPERRAILGRIDKL